MKPTQRSQIRSIKFLLAWIVANFIGGFWVGYFEDNGMQFMATIVYTGIFIGTLQWAVLWWAGNRRSRWWLWPLVSALGWNFGITLLLFSVSFIGDIANGLAHQFGLWATFWSNLMLGPIWVSFMAIAQGVLLSRRTQFQGSVLGIWLLASWFGGAVNGATGAALCSAYCQVLPQALIGLVNGAGWGAYGLITGVVLFVRPGLLSGFQERLLTDTPVRRLR
ncbi:MAG: hypothetical protein F6J95_019090 [Leptolyngbya sp. SIO1E4]|nr:hypothetical protein [Leptolyngbya sp. SIO1E4]